MIPVDELVPHSGDMVLIDQILACAENTLSARVVIAPGGLFNHADGSVPAWLGLELMAQSIAAWAGWHARQEQRPVQLGFLLGTRNYNCSVDRFTVGTELRIDIDRSLQDDSGIAVFECNIHGPDLLASARVNVFQPTDAAQYLQES
ncbi:hotdog family protein [Pigmentiphaga aceris]|uniref:Hotdog family protein n=1 Tax=Pigmentiphaga aceris TaxID=1940612 RepID=A0A5C0B6L0_9BURK|nr:hotdog family protein [Pigmentiphaga aceris]